MFLRRTKDFDCQSAHGATSNHRIVLGLALLASLGAGGCRHNVYSPDTLPYEYAASPVIDVHSLDLGRMAGRSAGSEIIYPGDTLQVLTATGAEEDTPEGWELRVVDDGSVTVPLVGPVSVAGLNLVQAEYAVRDACKQRRVFRHPNVRVKISKRRVNRVAVTGAVNKPDTYELPAASSHLAAALLAAGGLKENADRIVEIRQPRTTPEPDRTAHLASYEAADANGAHREAFEVDLAAAVSTANEELQLRDGAVVTVRQRPDRYVHVVGITVNQAIELPPDRNVTLLEAVAQAGGPRYSPWISDRVTVTRHVPGSDETIRIKVSMREAKREGEANILLAAGDIVSVEENALTFTLSTLGALVGIGSQAAIGASTGL